MACNTYYCLNCITCPLNNLKSLLLSKSLFKKSSLPAGKYPFEHCTVNTLISFINRFIKATDQTEYLGIYSSAELAEYLIVSISVQKTQAHGLLINFKITYSKRRLQCKTYCQMWSIVLAVRHNLKNSTDLQKTYISSLNMHTSGSNPICRTC